MLSNAYTMFDSSKLMFKKLKKETYAQRMDEFRSDYASIYNEMTKTVADAIDKEAAAIEVGEAFTENVYNHYAKRGKVRGTASSDLCLFMVYYVFPALLLTEDENATLIADNIRDAWIKKFKNEGMGYATYEEIYGSFKEKIFGLF